MTRMLMYAPITVQAHRAAYRAEDVRQFLNTDLTIMIAVQFLIVLTTFR